MLKEKKKVLSKTLAFVLVLVMVIGLMPVVSFAEGEENPTQKELLIEFYKATDPKKPVELVTINVDTEKKEVKIKSFSIKDDIESYLNFATTAFKEENDEVVIQSEEFRKVFDNAVLKIGENGSSILENKLGGIGYKSDDYSSAPTNIQYEILDYSKVKRPNSVYDNLTNETTRVIKVRIQGKKYPVHFDVNMPELDSPSTQFVEYNTRATRPADPEKDGYRFEGWEYNGNKDPFNATSPAKNKSQKIKEERTYIAKWSPEPPSKKEYPIEITLTKKYLNGEDDVVFPRVKFRPYKNELEIQGVSEKIILNGEVLNKAKRIAASVHEKEKVETQALLDFFNDVYLDLSEEARAKVNTSLEKAGYITEDDRKNIKLESSINQNEPRLDVVFYIKPMTVTFNPNNGENTFEQQVEYNKRVVKPSDPVKPGYVFKGWFKDSENEPFVFEKGTANDKYRVTSNFTLTAKWERKPVTITLTKKHITDEAEHRYADTIVDLEKKTISFKKDENTIGTLKIEDLKLADGESKIIEDIVAKINKGYDVDVKLLHTIFKTIFNSDKLKEKPLLRAKIAAILNQAGYTQDDYDNLKLEAKVESDDKMDVALFFNTFTVNFNSDGGKLGKDTDNQIVEYRRRVRKPQNDPTRNGYVFEYWYRANDGAQANYFEDVKKTTQERIAAEKAGENDRVKALIDLEEQNEYRVMKDLTLVAKWRKNEEAAPNTGGGGSTGGGDTAGGGGGGGGTLSPTDNNTTIDDNKTPLGAAKENNLAYMNGYKDGTVNPEGAVTREVAAAIFFRLMDEKARAAARSEENSFTDVKKMDWSNKHISTLVKAGILTGYTDGSFQPQKPITRAELASMLVKFYKLEAEKEHKFSDLKGNWAEEFIAALAKKGWVGGYPDGSFLPNKTVTRAELATIINNVLGRKIKKEELPEKLNKFSDLAADKWYYEALILATTNYVSERKEDGTQKFLETFESLIEM